MKYFLYTIVFLTLIILMSDAWSDQVIKTPFGFSIVAYDYLGQISLISNKPFEVSDKFDRTLIPWSSTFVRNNGYVLARVVVLDRPGGNIIEDNTRFCLEYDVEAIANNWVYGEGSKPHYGCSDETLTQIFGHTFVNGKPERLNTQG